MGFWDSVKSGLKKAVEEGWVALKDGAKIGNLRYRIYTLHRKAEKDFAEIGGIVYDMAKPPFENPLARPDVKRLVEGIRKTEDETASVEAEIAEVKKKEGR